MRKILRIKPVICVPEYSIHYEKNLPVLGSNVNIFFLFRMEAIYPLLSIFYDTELHELFFVDHDQ